MQSYWKILHVMQGSVFLFDVPMWLKQPPLGPSAEASQLENQPVSVNAKTSHSKYQKAASASPVTFEPDDHREQTSHSNYMKGLEGSPGVNTMRTDDVLISTGGIPPPDFVEKSESMEANDDSVSVTPYITTGQDLNVDSSCGKLRTESDLKGTLNGDHEAILSSLGDQITTASGTEKIVVGKSTEKGDAVPQLMHKEVRWAENFTDTADIKLDSCFEYENVRPSDSENDTCQTSIEDKGADNISGSKVQVQNTDGLAYDVAKSARLLDDVHGFCNEVVDAQEQMIAKSELLGNDKNKSVNANTKAVLTKDNVGEPYNTELKHSFVDSEVMFGSGNREIGEKMDVISEAHQERIAASSSVVPHGSEEISLPAFLSRRHSERSSSAQDNMQRCVVEVDASLSTSIGVDLGTSDFMKNEVQFGADSFNSSRRDARSVYVLPGDVVSGVARDNANTVSTFRALEPGNIPFQSPIVVPREENPYGTESSSPCGTSSRKEPNPASVVNSANFFNPKRGSDANPVANKVVNFSSSHLYSPLGSREAPNVFGICNSVMEESKQKRDCESVLSSLSVSGHAHGMTGQIHDNRDNMNSNSSAPSATHLADLGGSISDINSGVLPSFPPQTMPTSPSPFSLWNDQSFGVEHDQSCDSSRDEARHGRVSESSSLSLASFQQTCNVGYNLNETYISAVDNFSRLNPLETDRDTDLMIGFRNLNARTNQDVVSEALWRSNEGNAMPSGLGCSTSSQGQLPSAFQPFDFLSDKGENDIFSVNEKFDNMANFGGLRSSAVEPMEFSFLTPQDSNPQLGGPKVLSYGNPGIEQGFESSVWLGKDASLPNMNARSSFSTACVWCGSQFQQESIDSDAQAGSIGYLCPTCKLA